MHGRFLLAREREMMITSNAKTSNELRMQLLERAKRELKFSENNRAYLERNFSKSTQKDKRDADMKVCFWKTEVRFLENLLIEEN